MLFEGAGGRRFTQDSPVLPDVWIRYCEKPESAADLLITPHRNARAGEIARELREEIDAVHQRDAGARTPARVAHMPGVVAAQLQFDELLRFVLPMTSWWEERSEETRKALGASQDRYLFPLHSDEIARLESEIERMKSRSSQEVISSKETRFPPDFLTIIELSGSILRDRAAQTDDARLAAMSPAAAFSAVFMRMESGRKPMLPQEAGARANSDSRKSRVWRVALNRPTEMSIKRSTLAVKADAARRLFDVSCKEITWAIIDSGIDSRHAAFRDWTVGDEEDGKAGKEHPSRVDRTYDFTRVRTLLDPAAIAPFEGDDNLTPEHRALRDRIIANLRPPPGEDVHVQAAKHVKALRERLQQGLEIDWAMLEPFLLMTAEETRTAPPAVGHGTLVAGVLAADWREDRDRIVMQGVCPDIRLIDMRVAGGEADSNEFEAMAALQFIRYLNSRADSPVVHGANLSIGTPHSVASFACGSTPVCEECDRLWANGVVLVAAAGNKGHQRYLLAAGRELEGYHSISITDPGNAEGVITVGSTHRLRPHQYGVSYFSSRGPTGDGRRKPDLVAPGEKIEGPAPGGALGVGDGTSFAAPHVSGAAAMLMARHREFVGKPAEIKRILCATTTDLGREHYFQGAGMLDILRALQAI